MKRPSAEDYDRNRVPAGVYTPRARYEKMIEDFGSRGDFGTTLDELASARKDALAQSTATIANVATDPRATRKSQKSEWLTR